MDMQSKDHETLGESEPFLQFQQLLGEAARIDRPVLVIGERGSGKELAVSRLHFLSGRWNAPFIALNCAALSPGLIESELFGHESGAFTGAGRQRKGRFEEADGGTLFLDEIGLIPIEVQEKILRVVEYGAFQRVGSSVSTEVNVRIIGATNQDLPEMCEQGQFKRDLLDRLSFEVLFIPPLRERGNDILKLADYFARRLAHELERSVSPVFSKEVQDLMLGYSWPGNVRELKNAVERAVYREKSRVITQIVFDPFHNPWTGGVSSHPNQNSLSGDRNTVEERTEWPVSLKQELRNLEQRRLNQALERSGGHQGKAAELLGLNYNQFRSLFRKLKSIPEV